MKTIILDTNFVMIPFEFKVDIFDEIKRIADFPYKLAVADSTIKELNKVGNIAAKFALKLLEVHKVEIIKTGLDYADDAIADLAKHKDMIIATQDLGLKKRVNCPLIVLKGKSHLEYMP
jgi:hypothetical protein